VTLPMRANKSILSKLKHMKKLAGSLIELIKSSKLYDVLTTLEVLPKIRC